MGEYNIRLLRERNREGKIKEKAMKRGVIKESEARHHHKSLAVCWFDLANTYGSVHHSHIRFALNLYHAPPKFKNMLSVLYSGLAAQVSTPCWSTTTLPLQIKETHCQSLYSTQSSIHLLIPCRPGETWDIHHLTVVTKSRCYSMLMTHALWQTHLHQHSTC